MPERIATTEEYPSEAQGIDPIRSAFEAYLDAHFGRRDRKVVDTMLSTQVTGYGTGRDESTFGDLSMRELFERDFAAAPDGDIIGHTLGWTVAIKERDLTLGRDQQAGTAVTIQRKGWVALCL